MALIAIVHSKGDPWKAAAMFFGSDSRKKEAEKKRAYAKKCMMMAANAEAEAKRLDEEAEADARWLADNVIKPEDF